MDEKELEQLIPSKDVRDYIKEVNWTFTDAQKATLIANSGLLLEEEHSRLRDLCAHTDDKELQKQIAGYLSREGNNLHAFKENSDKSCVYLLKVNYGDGPYQTMPPDGCFFDWEMACEYGKKTGMPFAVEKHMVGDIKNRERYGRLDSHEIAWLEFDSGGEAVYFGYMENASDGTEPECSADFLYAFFEVPNPFEKGDIVKLAGEEAYGIVRTSQKSWKEDLDKHREGRHADWDYSDAQVVVEFLEDDGTFSHRHINPLCLERYQTEKGIDLQEGSPRDNLLLCAGQAMQGEGSLEDLYLFTMDYRNALEGI